MKKFLFQFIPLSLFMAFFPLSAFAQFYRRSFCFGLEGGLNELLCRLSGVLNSVLPVLVALGVVYLVWGIVQYFIRDNEEAKKAGRDRIIFGIIGLTVIISVWGLVYLITDTFYTEAPGPTGLDLQNLLP